MKRDIDQLMMERRLDAMVIEGPDGLSSANTAWRYMAKGAELTGTIIKRRNCPAQLLYHRMEQQQAEQTHLELVPVDRWDFPSILKRFPNRLDATVELYRQMFTDLGVRGRVGLYGTMQANAVLALATALQDAIPEVQLVGEFDRDVISEARQTKDEDELEHMADVGRRTCAVVQAVVDFISTQRIEGEQVVDQNGNSITIGMIHALIRQALDHEGLEAPTSTIFAQGRDAGIPHATGQLDAPLRVGEAIVLDIFPRDRTTGYYHDMTRTFAIGYAAPELQHLYNDVKQTFDAVVSALNPDGSTHDLQKLACRLLRERGHQTQEDAWPLEEGYIHSLGHGIGLDVHEALAMSTFVDRGDTIVPGTVFTIEPGLYYPSRQMGARIEDTFCCDTNGTVRSLTPFPYDLVIPLDQ